MTALLVLGSGISACSGIFGPDDILQNFETTPVERQVSHHLPTASVEAGDETVAVSGLLDAGACARLEGEGDRSGSTLRFTVQNATPTAPCPEKRQTIRYEARLGPLDDGQYRVRVALPSAEPSLETVTYQFQVRVDSDPDEAVVPEVDGGILLTEKGRRKEKEAHRKERKDTAGHAT